MYSKSVPVEVDVVVEAATEDDDDDDDEADGMHDADDEYDDESEVIRIVCYGHYDVVPVGDISKWNSDPFELTGRDGYVYARGSTDNKGPLIAYAYALKEIMESIADELEMAHAEEAETYGFAFSFFFCIGITFHASIIYRCLCRNLIYSGVKRKKLMPPFEVIILAEGHEEHGWENGGLKECVESNSDWLSNVSLILGSNSYWLGDKTPCLVYSMRGHVKLSIKISGPKQALHSGVHGGAFTEPAMDLFKVLAALQCDSSERKVKVPGFYDRVAKVTARERKLCGCISFSCASYRATVGVKKLSRKDKSSLLMARGREPSLSVHSVSLGNGGAGVIANVVSAIVSLRTVPQQSNDELAALVASYIRKQFAALDRYSI